MKAALLSWAAAPRATAQVLPPPRIDTVIVTTRNVFDSTEARRNVLFRLANALRFTTRPSVVQRELLFRAGEPFDSVTVAETRRNLRGLGIFREVTIDTVRRDGRLAALVRTADGWSTSLELNGRVTAGRVLWSAGLTESNFLGTNTLVGAGYRHDADRDAFSLGARSRRALGSPLAAGGVYEKLSDGRRGEWHVGLPYRSFAQRRSVEVVGEASRQRVLRFRRGGATGDSLLVTAFQRRSLAGLAVASLAPVATSRGYLRVGVAGLVRREELIREADTLLAIPDTVTAIVAAFAEFQRARFTVVTHYNGFAREEDIDLSTRIEAAVGLAPAAFGYPRTGLASFTGVQAGVLWGKGFARFNAAATALVTAAGLDSGQVQGGLTVASRVIRRQATVLRVEAGAQKSPAPGKEFDLGDQTGPRAFGPHAFVGTRTVWGILEHRVFLLDQVLGLLGLGVAGFLDYGGAWYPDQAARFGGDVGFGLRMGPTRATGANLGRADLAYRFGAGAAAGRWVFSLGRSYTF